ncbi:hypothetical protein P153DRAFT_389888 [Dothidotthia symphoricarpi CBS 119687]|uniref:Uncharacterized protein n=1 Tax=Dothidotthia symphoricarpi CBS 119687 TaxID=1392245 RepID=A0A6A6A1I2_9PLEO|nr:uncharacterized protein P153DRAFT_389888 [Dothidotthia symphoricarpi CBS 119687]KAF2125033.1 hypothetical protein P153DRAFT_389888 [Dothidotthia symphoricarpi CBS 119687]
MIPSSLLRKQLTRPHTHLTPLLRKMSTPSNKASPSTPSSQPQTQPQQTAPPTTDPDTTAPLTLPEPSTATHKLNVNGQGVKLDHLGPLVVNRDGTLSRIANWESMADIERSNTVRILGKRNMLRLEGLRGEGEVGGVEK